MFTLFIKLTGFSTVLSSLLSLLNVGLVYLFGEQTYLKVMNIGVGQDLLFIFLGVLLMYYADKLVSVFNLSKGFIDQTIALEGITSTDVVKIGVFIMGGYLLLDNISFVITAVIQRFSASASESHISIFTNYDLVKAGLNLVLAYLMLTNFSAIAKWFVQKGTEEKE
ncbi:hypothetical protein VSO92_08350 [Myroides pelagicus]|uniref:hypothetical protein n=1 Tax=Myroides pelagicus TaxID=270914 RepID=UPI002DBCC1E6|nr:hypothetical protein [Myroides pelagicus]MEC4114116.1 hypothetical protein [Myroides pelagicus]